MGSRCEASEKLGTEVVGGDVGERLGRAAQAARRLSSEGVGTRYLGTGVLCTASLEKSFLAKELGSLLEPEPESEVGRALWRDGGGDLLSYIAQIFKVPE